jgi:cytochrome c-type biogenesis protein CcmH
MKKFAEILLLCAAISLLVGADEGPDARFKRLGGKIMCTCGSCEYMLLECNHVGCPNSTRMIGQLHALTGSLRGPGSEEYASIQPESNDQAVLNWFRRSWGVTAVVEPGTKGFELLAWVLPWLVPALGLLLIGIAFVLWSSRRTKASTASARLDPHLEALRERARRETEI